MIKRKTIIKYIKKYFGWVLFKIKEIINYFMDKPQTTG